MKVEKRECFQTIFFHMRRYFEISVSEILQVDCLSLFQLCATRKGRQFLIAKNTYIIMREYYAWERKQEPANENAAMNLIDVLIGNLFFYTTQIKELQIRVLFMILR